MSAPKDKEQQQRQPKKEAGATQHSSSRKREREIKKRGVESEEFFFIFFSVKKKEQKGKQGPENDYRFSLLARELRNKRQNRVPFFFRFAFEETTGGVEERKEKIYQTKPKRTKKLTEDEKRRRRCGLPSRSRAPPPTRDDDGHG